MSTHKISDRVFGAIAALVIRWPWGVVYVYLVLTVAASVLSWLKLESRTDQNDLMSSDLPYNVRYQEFLTRFGDLEYLYAVIVVNGQPEQAMQAADALAAEVSKLTEHVENVFHKVSEDAYGSGLLLLLPASDLKALAEALGFRRELIDELRDPRSLARQVEAIANALEASGDLSSTPFADHFFRFLDVMLESMAVAAKGGSPRPLLETLEERIRKAEKDPRKRGYVFSENGKLAFVQIMPKKDYKTLEVIRQPLLEIRAALDSVRRRFPDLEMGLTGRPVLQADEMSTTNEDTTISALLASLLVLGLTGFFFRRLRRPFLALASLLVSVGITLWHVNLTIGHLTLLSMVFAVMMIGLGCDLGTLFLVRYQEELIKSGSVERSMTSTLLTAGLGIWTGGITTACTFFSTLLVPFKGLAELGFVAGMGLVVCIATMLTLLPALIVITDRFVQRRRALKPPRPVEIPFLAPLSRHPRTSLAVLALVTLLGFIGFQGVSYNSNLLELQVQELESVRYERLIPELSGRSTWFAVFLEKSLEESDATVAALRPLQEKGIVGAVESLRDFVPAEQDVKIGIIDVLRQSLARGNEARAPEPLEPAGLKSALEKLLDRLDGLQSALASRGSTGEGDAAEAIALLDGLISKTELVIGALEAGSTDAIAAIDRHQAMWRKECRALSEKAEVYLSPRRITPADLPQELRSQFVSRDGSEYLVYAYPRKDVWKEGNMEELIDALRRIDPLVTGAPITTFESAKIIKTGFLLAGLYSLIIVFVFLVIDFRSFKYSCLTMAPVLVGLLWASLLMPRLGLDLNLANFFALPILLGCAVDGCVHMLHRFRECGSVELAVQTTGSAVCLAALSNMLGFLAMGVARHRGLASLGFLTALGCATILVASVVLLPSLLGLLRPRRESPRV